MNQDFLATETNRRQLQQIISGLSDGVILIEIDQSILWANEAALAMHGVSEVGELGANAAQYRKRFALRYRNHHALTADSYPIARVAKGETFSDLIVEVTPQAEPERTWVHNIRSMILTDRLIISDATELAVAEQRFEKAFGANPAPAVICRLSDLRYIKVNQGFLEMTGYGEGATIPQMQAELKLAQGGSKLVIVAGQPLDINEQDCMLFTFMDLEPRRRIETALRQSEERFAKAFRLAPSRQHRLLGSGTAGAAGRGDRFLRRR